MSAKQIFQSSTRTTMASSHWPSSVKRLLLSLRTFLMKKSQVCSRNLTWMVTVSLTLASLLCALITCWRKLLILWYWRWRKGNSKCVPCSHDWAWGGVHRRKMCRDGSSRGCRWWWLSELWGIYGYDHLASFKKWVIYEWSACL